MLAIIVALGIYRIGPTMDHEKTDAKLPLAQYDVKSVESFIQDREAKFNIKPDNEARIIWADTVGQKTEHVLLYIHGFSASWYEGVPVNVDFVKTMGCNAYFARLAEHGLVDDNPMLHMTPKKLYDSAKEALVIAKTLGQKVSIMSTSTGGTLSLMLAAQFPDLVDGLILYSPNIEIKQKAAQMLPMPWGLPLAKLMEGEMRHLEGSPKEAEYWYLDYRIEATVYLQQLVNEGMNEYTYSKVKCPVFLGYYYLDEDHQDQTVSVDAMHVMFDQLGSDKKVKMAFPDAGRHTIAFEEAGNPDKVTEETVKFAREYLGM